MKTAHRICGFAWTDEGGSIGSHHACGEEHGHVGVHDCISCHATCEQRPLAGATTPDGEYVVERNEA